VEKWEKLSDNRKMNSEYFDLQLPQVEKEQKFVQKHPKYRDTSRHSVKEF